MYRISASWTPPSPPAHLCRAETPLQILTTPDPPLPPSTLLTPILFTPTSPLQRCLPIATFDSPLSTKSLRCRTPIPLNWLENDDDVSIIEQKSTSLRKKSVKRKLCFLDEKESFEKGHQTVSNQVCSRKEELKEQQKQRSFKSNDFAVDCSMAYALACLGILGTTESEVKNALNAEMDEVVKIMDRLECSIDNEQRKCAGQMLLCALKTKYGEGKYHLGKNIGDCLPRKFLPNRRYLIEGILNHSYVYDGTFHEQENRDEFDKRGEWRHFIGLIPCGDSHLICCNQLPLCEKRFVPIEALHLSPDGHIDKKEGYMQDILTVYEIECEVELKTDVMPKQGKSGDWQAIAKTDREPGKKCSLIGCERVSEHALATTCCEEHKKILKTIDMREGRVKRRQNLWQAPLRHSKRISERIPWSPVDYQSHYCKVAKLNERPRIKYIDAVNDIRDELEMLQEGIEILCFVCV